MRFSIVESIIIIVVIIYVGTCIFCLAYLHIDEYLTKHRKKKKLITLFQQWHGFSANQWWEFSDLYAYVWYLDKYGYLNKVNFENFYNPNLPKKYEPKVWLITIDNQPCPSLENGLCLVWDNLLCEDFVHWHIYKRWEKWCDCKNNFFVVLEKNNQCKELKASDKEELIKMILQFVQCPEREEKVTRPETEEKATQTILQKVLKWFDWSLIILWKKD